MARILFVLFGLIMAGNAAALRDPTRPTDPALYFSGSHNDGWTLQSILVSSNRRIAIINGKRVQEGDRVGSARIARIRNSHVIIKTGDRTLTLRLRPDNMKTRP